MLTVALRDGQLAVQIAPWTRHELAEFKGVFGPKERRFVRGANVWLVGRHRLPTLMGSYAGRVRLSAEAEALWAQMRPTLALDVEAERTRLIALTAAWKAQDKASREGPAVSPLALEVAEHFDAKAPFRLKQEQLIQLDWVLHLPYVGNWSEVGTGKTPVIVAALDWWLDRGTVNRVLILATVKLLHQWEDEIRRLCGRQAVKVAGTRKQRIRALTSASRGIWVTNYDALRTMQAEFAALAPDAVIVDESHNIRNSEALRTQAAVSGALLARRRIALSGSPVLRSESDVFGQMLFLDPSICGDNFYLWRGRHFENRTYRVPVYDAAGNRKMTRDRTTGQLVERRQEIDNWQPRAGTKRMVRTLLRRHGCRFLVRKCWDLPPEVHLERKVDIFAAPGIKAVYEPMMAEAQRYVDDDDGAIRWRACGGLLMRMASVCGGWLKNEHGTAVLLDKRNPKMLALDAMLEVALGGGIGGDMDDNGSDGNGPARAKVIVYAYFVAELEHMATRYDKAYGTVLVRGGQTERRAAEALRAFKDPEGPRLMVAQPGAAGEGLNLTIAAQIVYYSRVASAMHVVQTQGRIRRPGAERHRRLVFTDIIATLPPQDGEERESADQLFLWASRRGVRLNSSLHRDHMRRIAGRPRRKRAAQG